MTLNRITSLDQLQQELPERWNGIWSPDPMQILTDAFTVILGDREAYPTNDYDRLNVSLLPLRAWALRAIAFDPGGPPSQHRRALKEAQRLSTLIGSRAAFDLLMSANGTSGDLRFVGDYDSAGTKVPRSSESPRRMTGTHSLHTADPVTPDTDRDTGEPTAGFVGDGTTYHKFVAIDLALPVDRVQDTAFVQYITRASRETIPYTLELAELNIVSPIRVELEVPVHAQGWSVQWIDLVEGVRWP